MRKSYCRKQTISNKRLSHGISSRNEKNKQILSSVHDINQINLISGRSFKTDDSGASLGDWKVRI